ncbi:zf-HC2 domain-containing protein [Streptomyces sp. NPDC006475]|uniref:Zf-HC2 domain-containing protein n=1 Tax=Streptomyces achmelvichensis TaxID=3134111 RepID=A0ACC6Q6F5_9ACTN|nr:zf-HC2 domain-containing protein [Streptomyces sp. NBC_01167]
MGMQQRHQDVAAYALGVLEPGDAFRFEEHLAECVLCTVQLSDFSSVASAISDLTGPGVIASRPSPRLLERLTEEVALMRRRSSRRRLRLVAAVAALIVALPLGALAMRTPQDPVPPAVAGKQVTVKDAGSGVTASAFVEDRMWGTAVAMRLSGLTGPGSCRLVAVGKDGIEHPVLSWRVPQGGYGTDVPGHAKPLEIEGGTDLASRDIGRWEVRTFDGKPLLTIK